MKKGQRVSLLLQVHGQPGVAQLPRQLGQLEGRLRFRVAERRVPAEPRPDLPRRPRRHGASAHPADALPALSGAADLFLRTAAAAAASLPAGWRLRAAGCRLPAGQAQLPAAGLLPAGRLPLVRPARVAHRRLTPAPSVRSLFCFPLLLLLLLLLLDSDWLWRTAQASSIATRKKTPPQFGGEKKDKTKCSIFLNNALRPKFFSNELLRDVSIEQHLSKSRRFIEKYLSSMSTQMCSVFSRRSEKETAGGNASSGEPEIKRKQRKKTFKTKDASQPKKKKKKKKRKSMKKKHQDDTHPPPPP